MCDRGEVGMFLFYFKEVGGGWKRVGLGNRCIWGIRLG